jgi:two-component system nitrogen regulation sensor histidine kinase NtrY
MRPDRLTTRFQSALADAQSLAVGRDHNQLEAERGTLLFNFALLYLGFALILILGAIWLGLWFAEGLSRPVGRLAAAAEAVGQGNLDVQVPEDPGEDEIATMGRVFNAMTRQLKGQRQTLLANTAQIEERRRLFDSVLSSVTAGVIGLDAQGRVTFVNRAAEALASVERALALAPDHPEALLERGILRQLRGDADGARRDWERVLAVAPDSLAADLADQNLSLNAAGPVLR